MKHKAGSPKFIIQLGNLENQFKKVSAFSEIGDKLYAASGNKVYIYSFPSLTLESIIDANISIEELFVDNGKLMLIGVLNPTSPSNTYIEIIDL